MALNSWFSSLHIPHLGLQTYATMPGNKIFSDYPQRLRFVSLYFLRISSKQYLAHKQMRRKLVRFNVHFEMQYLVMKISCTEWLPGWSSNKWFCRTASPQGFRAPSDWVTVRCGRSLSESNTDSERWAWQNPTARRETENSEEQGSPKAGQAGTLLAHSFLEGSVRNAAGWLLLWCSKSAEFPPSLPHGAFLRLFQTASILSAAQSVHSFRISSAVTHSPQLHLYFNSFAGSIL